MTSILTSLKQATWPLHQRLERRLNLLSPSFSSPDYLRLIQSFWGYCRPLESRLAQLHELPHWLPDIHLRAKSPLLEQDLQLLGVAGDDLAQLPLCTDLPVCDNIAAALGCLYVMEGASLGGQVISRHLSQTLGLDADNGAAFFNGYGVATGEMWQSFRASVLEAKADESIQIHSACETFLTLERWLLPTKQNTDENL